MERRDPGLPNLGMFTAITILSSGWVATGVGAILKMEGKPEIWRGIFDDTRVIRHIGSASPREQSRRQKRKYER